MQGLGWPLLEKFLELYTRDDGFTRAAKQALKRIDYGLPPESGSRLTRALTDLRRHAGPPDRRIERPAWKTADVSQMSK